MLGLEFVVIALAVPVAIRIGGYSPAVAGGVWGGLALAALVLACLQSFRWAHYAGWALQVATVASGLAVPGLAFLGLVFAALWIAAVVLGRRAESARAA